MNLSKVKAYSKVGDAYIAVDAEDRVVGVIREIGKQIHNERVECLRMAHRQERECIEKSSGNVEICRFKGGD